jgi:hypothetical protein
MAVEKELPNLVERASNADRARYALRASPSAREAKRSDDYNLSGKQSKEGTSVHTSPGRLIFTAAKWISFRALQTLVGDGSRFEEEGVG